MKILISLCIILFMFTGCSKTESSSNIDSSSNSIESSNISDSNISDSNISNSNASDSNTSDGNIVESKFLNSLLDAETKSYKNLDEISSEMAKDNITSMNLTTENIHTYTNSAMYYTIIPKITDFTEVDLNDKGKYWKATYNSDITNDTISMLISNNIKKDTVMSMFNTSQTIYGYAYIENGVVYIVPFIYGTNEFKSIPENINLLKKEIVNMSKE